MDCELNHKEMDARSSISDSSSTTSSGVAAATGRDCDSNWKCEGDPMARIELEAAEALAGLAHSVMPENETRGRNDWGRSSQRVKTESPAGDSGTNPEGSGLRSSDPAEQKSKNIYGVMMEGVKVEQNAELAQPSPMCTLSYASFSGNKSRQKLTESEKEAKRIRRVLANRESARQTIRRRQALYEELTRKATSLAWQNENLKREKEVAMKEYDSLKSKNENLKAQMAKTANIEVEETRVDSKSTSAEICSSPCPFLIYNEPSFAPFRWPSLIRSSNPLQVQNGVVPSKVPMSVTGKPGSFHEQENPLKISGSETPLYIVPCPWFFPLLDHGFHPPSNLNDERHETSINNQSSASSTSIKVKTKTSSSTETMPANDTPSSFLLKTKSANNLYETPFGFPPDGSGQSKGVVLMPAPLKSVRPISTFKHQIGHQPDNNPESSSHAVNAAAEMKQDLDVFPNKKQADAVTAAEARKRRKELTKLKSLHGRQSCMH